MSKFAALARVGREIGEDIIAKILDDAPAPMGHNNPPPGGFGLETIDLPAGNDPRYRGAAPDRSGGAYQRYVPTRGVPERMQRLIAAADDPANPINGMFDRYIERGKGLDGPDWYNSEELRDWYISELGPELGDARWREYIELVGTTSTGSSVPPNLRNASFYQMLQGPDRVAVAELVAQGGITPADAAKQLGIEVPNMPDNYRYGHVMQGNHAKNVLSREAGGWSREVPEGLLGAELTKWLQANPKVKGFANDLLGNETNIAADKHFMRMLAMSDGGLDFLSDGAQLSAENIERARAAIPGLDPYIATRKTGTGQTVTQINLAKAAKDGVVTDTSVFSDIPQAWLDTPKDTEYAALEEMAQRMAARYDMTPAQFQASLWMGAGDITGLADESQGTFMELMRRSIDKRAGERGISRRDMARDFLHGRAPLAVTPLAGAGLLGTFESPEQAQQDPALAAYLRGL